MDATIYHRDGREQTIDANKASRLTAADKDWSFVKPPPPGWEREIPKYRATRDIHPAEKSRVRFEPPFAQMADSDTWQYGTRIIKAGEIIETKEWPHPSFCPLNYGAGKVLDFFNQRQKSRLALSPWRNDRLILEDGLTSGAAPLRPAQPQAAK
jgi:hypothetical protein